MKKTTVLLIITSAIFASIFASSFSRDRIIAVVGDSIILKSDVEAYTDMILQQSGGGDMLLRNIVFEQALQELITSRILVAHADSDTNIRVYDYDVNEQVNARINHILTQNRMTREQLAAVLREQENMTLNEFRNQLGIQIRQEMIKQQVMQHYIVDRDLSREEVRMFFNRYRDSLPPIGESVRLQRIEIQVGGDSVQRQRAFDTITFVRRQIVERGASFQDMARRYSQSPNAADGGNLGFIGRGTLAIPRLESVAFSLDPGEVSNVIETRLGWHLLTVTERVGGQVLAYHIFIPVNANEARLEQAMQTLDSVATSNPTNEQFIEAVERFSTDRVSRAFQGDIDWQLLSALDRQVRASFPSIEAGVVGRPFRRDNTISLYRISGYNRNRQFDFESDFDEIARFASQMHAQERLLELINRWREEVFIKIYQ